jgi:hypothetical protein
MPLSTAPPSNSGQPQDDVAVALAGAAQRVEPGHHAGIKLDVDVAILSAAVAARKCAFHRMSSSLGIRHGLSD